MNTFTPLGKDLQPSGSSRAHSLSNRDSTDQAIAWFLYSQAL